MKRIGLIAYSNNSGLGTIAFNFRKHLPISSQFIIKHPIKGTHDINIPYTFGDIETTEVQLLRYLDKCSPEIVIIIETPFNFKFFKLLHDRGIKIILIPMIDSIGVKKFIPYEEYIDLVINFTNIGHKIYTDQWNKKHIYLPYPIDTGYFKPSKILPKFTFTHSAGWGGAHYRKATDLVFTAFRQLQYIDKTMSTLYLHGQPGENKYSLYNKNISTTLCIKDFKEAKDIYTKGKIYVAPSRREGLGLPILEAMSCGLPVITTNAPPMNEWFPVDYPLLINTIEQATLKYGDNLMYTPNTYNLLEKMRFAQNNMEEMVKLGQTNRAIIQNNYSWKILRSKYMEYLK